MKDLKFRIWSHSDNRMFGPFNIFELIRNEDQDLFLYENIHIMQYTGFKDKKGLEIYEGDILKDPKGKIKQLVSFDTPVAVGGMIWGYNLALKYNPVMCEIIGNIYENLDLVKESK